MLGLCIVAFSAACGNATTQQNSTPTPATGSFTLTLDGTGTPHVVSATQVADQFIFKGVTIWGLPNQSNKQTQFANSQWANRRTVVSTVKSWGANAIRLRVDGAAYEGQQWLPKADYVRHVLDWVNAASAQGLYVVICNWDGLYEQHWGLRSAAYMRNTSLVRALYAAIGNNTHVAYEMFDEPNGSSATWQTWLTVMKATVSTYRKLGYTSLLLVDTPDWSHDYNLKAMSQLFQSDAQAGVAQLAFTRHDYASMSIWAGGWNATAWLTAVGGKSNPFPLIESEFGNYSNYVSDIKWSRSAANFFGKSARKEKFYGGAFAFLFGPWFDANAMTLPDNQTPTSWGAVVKNSFLAP